MVFCSLIFLFAFLPIVLAGYFLLRTTYTRNIFLLLASLFFYAWGEIRFVWIMVASIVANYVLAMLIEDSKTEDKKKLLLALTVAVNLGILGFFKYSGWIVQNLNNVLTSLNHAPIVFKGVALPLGISFFTFHALSYVIDVYRKQAKAQRNPINLALYISLFPQLVAGPIIRYHDVCDQLIARTVNVDKFAEGVRRFVTGLGKKMLIANMVAGPADKIFALSTTQMTPELAWLGALCYTLQIYFDFSGYSDMAIGLGLMFGFRFLENFNYPYISQSIREFWQRWHISLSNWFRDYLYIPLGGNRKGEARTCLNLVTVFFLCGLWHGASWTFVFWGLYHGFFLGLERLGFGKLLERIGRPVRHVYTLAVVMVGWVFFRANTFPQAIAMCQAMVGKPATEPGVLTAEFLLDGRLIFVILLGVLISTPIMRKWVFKPELDPTLSQSGIPILHPHVVTNKSGIDVLEPETATAEQPAVAARQSSVAVSESSVAAPQQSRPVPQMRAQFVLAAVRTFLVMGILAFSIMEMASGTYNPFIYFRF
jgi:alginate O-acetyltransferase complex protein AlgI